MPHDGASEGRDAGAAVGPCTLTGAAAEGSPSTGLGAGAGVGDGAQFASSCGDAAGLGKGDSASDLGPRLGASPGV